MLSSQIEKGLFQKADSYLNVLIDFIFNSENKKKNKKEEQTHNCIKLVKPPNSEGIVPES